MNAYLPVLIILVFSIVFGMIISGISMLLGPKRSTKIKSEPYECGTPMVTDAKQRMSVKFFLTAILFILFDIETIFLYLWAKTFGDLGWFGVAEVAVFVAILLVGYVYVLKSGALEWE